MTERMRRADRREQVLAAATVAFARAGYAATSLDDVAAVAGVTRVVLYRHFDSKHDLYAAVVDRMCEQLEERATGFTDETVDGLLAVAAESSAGFTLVFRHALREPEFNGRLLRLRAEVVEAAHRQVAQVVPDPDLARWAAQAAPAAAIEATLAWLDAGQPDPAGAAERIRRVALSVVAAAVPVEG